MNIDNYNFYGNYENNDNSFSIYEIHKRQRKKEIRRVRLYKKILNRCFYKINLAVEKEQLFCFYQLPEYVSGSPLYNMTDCLFFILEELANKGFSCKYCHPLQIYITWPQKEKNLKLDYTPQMNKSNNTEKLEKEININYNLTNDYRLKGDFDIKKDKSINEVKNKFHNLPINNNNISFKKMYSSNNNKFNYKSNNTNKFNYKSNNNSNKKKLIF